MGLGMTFKALSDETRREIIKLLKDKDMSAGEIAEAFTISKPSISHHLNILKQADLIWDERQGQNIIYTINTSVMEEIMGWILEFTNTKGGDGDGKETN
jgi:DNA-binding transcriptional ArsR family regulator